MKLKQITKKDQLDIKKLYFDSIISIDETIYSQEQKRAWASQAWENKNFNLSINEALDYFSAIPKIYNKFKTLQDVGLGYLKLGQSATTLSGGEAQRIKLAAELSKRSTGKTVYILDEPTTGLHFADVHKLIEVLERLRDEGNTIIVIEHNLDMIKRADYIIDMGPEGGINGGKVIAFGTPEKVSKSKLSFTGKYLKNLL